METEKWWAQLKKYRKLEPEKMITIPEYEEELKFQIKDAAYFLSQKNHSYDELCWFLAENQLIVQKGYYNVAEDDIREIAEEIFKSSFTYEGLCWLITELNVLIKKGYFDVK